jgi:hypothetical protein
MKNKEKIIEGFKAVKFMRDVRDKISNDISDMDFVQIKKYFEERKLMLFQNAQ